MEKLFYLFSLLFLTFCKAQTPIIDLYGSQDYGAINNAYYKDVNGFQDQYVGTWLYTNGNTSLKIIFQKKSQIRVGEVGDSFFSDFLVGEYQYIENGIEKVNTLNYINTNYGSNIWDVEKHNLNGDITRRATSYPKCTFCNPNELRLALSLSEPQYTNWTGLANSFILKTFSESGVTKLKVWFVSNIQVAPEDANGTPVTNFAGFSLPFGEYTLIKQ